MNPTLHVSKDRYSRSVQRLETNLRTGRFALYSHQKKKLIWNRLCRYARQAGISIKSSLAAACFAAGLCFAGSASAQPFVQQTGSTNPFDGISIGNFSTPVFVDIDGDGDKDLFIGEEYGGIVYYENTGTATAPVYVLRSGAANPLNSANSGGYSAPAFADIDGDGDMDFFVGNYDGTILYYENTGSATMPVFTQRTGELNPLDGVIVHYNSTPTFVDIDGDGDLDVFIGSGYYGAISFYKNNGSATTPAFTATTSPLGTGDGVYYTAPTFIDIDGDGDKDAFIGISNGTILYYENTGTATVPVFTSRTGSNNPLNGIDVGTLAKPAFADVDGDGDLDLLIGAFNGSVSYFRNNATVLPLHLLSFSGTRQSGYNELTWKTAAELNTKSFEIERSNNGNNFNKIATVPTTGNSSNTYSVHDNISYSGKAFYRLKMIDIDGRFTYSQIIWISDKGGKIIIYPNPAVDVINLNTGSASVVKTYAGIYDVNGRLVKNILINATQQQINVQTLAKGIYQIKFADGSVQGFIKK